MSRTHDDAGWEAGRGWAKTHDARPSRSLYLTISAALIVVVATVATVGGLGFSASAKSQVDHEVTALLAGIPQEGATLGEPRAPITLQVFADLECPTVKRFVTSRLPAIIDAWVRKGVIKIEYRSLETDTESEPTFFRQEMAALAASRQNRMWNFVLTAIHEQHYKKISSGVLHFEYVTEEFLADIASRVPGLDMAQWARDRRDAPFSSRVARDVHRAHVEGMHATPAFLIGRTGGRSYRRIGPKTEHRYLIDAASLEEDVEAFLGRSAAYLRNFGVPEAMQIHAGATKVN